MQLPLQLACKGCGKPMSALTAKKQACSVRCQKRIQRNRTEPEMEIKMGRPVGTLRPKSIQYWIFEESHGQHGHRCSACSDWVNYDCGQSTCRCGHPSPHNPLRDRIAFLESVITAYEELSAKQSNLVNLLKR